MNRSVWRGLLAVVLLVFSSAALAPGQALTAGPIRVAGERAGRVRVSWRVRLPDGATVLSGESEAKP